MKGVIFGIPVVAVLSLGCGGTQSPTAPSVVAGPTTELFVGTLDVRGSGFYSFTVSQTGNVNLLLASLTASGRNGLGPALTTTLGIGLGVPSGTGCALDTSVETPPALVSQITLSMAAGIHCAEIHDIGKLTSSVNFTLRIIHP